MRSFGWDVRVGMAVLAVLAIDTGRAHADSIFSTFGPGDSFDSNRAYEVENQPFSPPLYVDRAMSFTPLGGAFVLDRIELAVSATNTLGRLPALDVSVASDAGGVPGSIIETVRIDGVTVPGVYAADSLARPVLGRGATYWLVAQADITTRAEWYFNSVGEVGEVATRVGNPAAGWSTAEATQGAFRLSGTPLAVPEPPTATLFGLGGVGLLGYGRRHCKRATA